MLYKLFGNIWKHFGLYNFFIIFSTLSQPNNNLLLSTLPHLKILATPLATALNRIFPYLTMKISNWTKLSIMFSNMSYLFFDLHKNFIILSLSRLFIFYFLLSELNTANRLVSIQKIGKHDYSVAFQLHKRSFQAVPMPYNATLHPGRLFPFILLICLQIICVSSAQQNIVISVKVISVAVSLRYPTVMLNIIFMFFFQTKIKSSMLKETIDTFRWPVIRLASRPNRDVADPKSIDRPETVKRHLIC